MWKRSGLLFYSLLALSLLFSPVCFAAEPLTEEEVRTWAQTRTREQVTEKLIEAVMLIETLDKGLTEIKETSEASAIHFEAALKEKTEEIKKASQTIKSVRQENFLLKIGIGVACVVAAFAVAR